MASSDLITLSTGRGRARTVLCASLAVACQLGLMSATVLAGEAEREQAKRVHDRLVGVPPAEDMLLAMETILDGDNSFDGLVDAGLS